MVYYNTIPHQPCLLQARRGADKRDEGTGTMLVLLSAPRGRVSAARIAARIREDERAEAQRGAGPPSALAAPAAPEYHPRAHLAAADEPAQPRRASAHPTSS